MVYTTNYELHKTSHSNNTDRLTQLRDKAYLPAKCLKARHVAKFG